MSPDLLAGRYELTKRIAGGGMGQVWRGRDRVLERIVAIKTVDLSAQEPTARERFRREAIATATLSAPNIVQVYDAGVDNATAYLVMELLSGPTLSQVIHDGGPMDLQEGVKVTLEVARALLTAHKIGIVHRDIKPGNVMYHHDQVKLVDFGIAQLARNLGATLTAPATALGTAAYMSPEQAAGEGATDKSDWYALGCLMTTIFTGEPPFSGDALAVASQQINAKPPFLSERRPEVPPALDRLVAGLLAKEPGDRPTGEQVVDQLHEFSVDPTAGTLLMAGAAGAGGIPGETELYDNDGTAVWDGTAADAPSTRARYGESPGGPVSPVRPVAPAPPLPPLDTRRGAGKRRPVGLIIAVILAVLALGLGGAYFLLGDDAEPAPVVATPTPTPTAERTTTRPTTTRAVPTRVPTTRRPTTTQPPTTAPPTTTSAPLETVVPPPDEGNGNGNGGGSGNGNGGGSGNENSDGNGNGNNGGGNGNGGENQGGSSEAAMESGIANVENRTVQSALSAMWVQAEVTGDPDGFLETLENWHDQGLLSKGETKSLTRAAEKSLGDG